MVIGSIIGIATSLAIALWLALTDNAIYALALVIAIALLRLAIRAATGKRFRPADMAGPDHGDR